MSKVLSLDKLSCPQIFKIEEEKDREIEKVRRQASEAQREKQLQPRTKPVEIHYKNTYFFTHLDLKDLLPPSPSAMVFALTQEMHT